MTLKHKLQTWYLNRQADKLLKEINRTYQQSRFQLNPQEETGITRQEIFCGLAILAALIFVIVLD